MKKPSWKSFCQGYTRFVENQGFAIIVTTCVAVITATALWTGRSKPTPQSPSLPQATAFPASLSIQEHLPSATHVIRPAATPDPTEWYNPLSDCIVLRPYHESRMVQSGVTGVWHVHHAVDLAADKGEPVCAIADGIVADCSDDSADGAWVLLTHADGTESRYASMALLAALQPGDQVRAGQTLGFASDTMCCEADLGPHLHLEVFRQGTPTDPLVLLQHNNSH